MGKMGKITHARVRNKKKSEHEIKKKVYIIIFLNIRKVYFFLSESTLQIGYNWSGPRPHLDPWIFGPQDI